MMFAVRTESRWWLALVIAVSHVWAFGMGFAFRAESAAMAQETTTAEAPTEEPAPAEEPAAQEPAAAEAPAAEAPAAEGPAEGLTADLGLVSAAVDSVNLDDGVEEYVRYTFANFIRSVDGTGGFSVRSETGASEVLSTSATLVDGSSDEVLVGFPDGTDLNQYLSAAVASGVVIDTSGMGNVGATVALQAANRGFTSGPDLLQANGTPTLNRVTYTFDSILGIQTAPEPSNFGYRTTAGKDVEATSVLTVDDDFVTVGFDSAIESGARFFVRAGAVEDRLGQANPPFALLSGDGGTAAPELAGVAAVEGSSTQYDFTFTLPVMPLDPGLFALYTSAGERYAAEDWTRVSPDTLRLFVPDVKDIGNEIVLGAVDAEAVQDTSNSDGVYNGVFAVAVGEPDTPAGGPELASGEVEQDTGQVTFRFSTPPDDSVDVDPANFLALTDAGELVPAKRFLEVNGEDVLIGFDANIVAAADRFVIQAGAVANDSGRVNAGATMDVDGNVIPQSG